MNDVITMAPPVVGLGSFAEHILHGEQNVLEVVVEPSDGPGRCNTFILVLVNDN